jgi:hypothetical protein
MSAMVSQGWRRFCRALPAGGGALAAGRRWRDQQHGSGAARASGRSVGTSGALRSSPMARRPRRTVSGHRANRDRFVLGGALSNGGNR